DEVLDRGVGDGSVVGFYARQIGKQTPCAQVDGRQCQLLDELSSAGRLDACEDPVTPPTLHPGEVGLLPAVLGQVEGPRAALDYIAVDSDQESASVRVGRLDK